MSVDSLDTDGALAAAAADADRLAEALDAAAAIGKGMSLAGWWQTFALPALAEHENFRSKMGKAL